MPDLGDYAFNVLACYAVTIGLLAVIVGLSWAGARRSRIELEKVEQDG